MARIATSICSPAMIIGLPGSPAHFAVTAQSLLHGGHAGQRARHPSNPLRKSQPFAGVLDDGHEEGERRAIRQMAPPLADVLAQEARADVVVAHATNEPEQSEV